MEVSGGGRGCNEEVQVVVVGAGSLGCATAVRRSRVGEEEEGERPTRKWREE